MCFKIAVISTIREKRKEKGIGYLKLSKITGISTRYLVKLEKENINISIEILFKICNGIGISVTDIIKAAEDKIQDNS